MARADEVYYLCGDRPLAAFLNIAAARPRHERTKTRASEQSVVVLIAGNADEPGKRPLIALRRTLFVISLPLGLLGLMLPIYGHEIGASAVQIGLFLSVFSLVRVLLRPWSAWAWIAMAASLFCWAGWRDTR